MGNRLSKIITKTGDRGETGLGNGSRVLKSCARVHAMGELDELNCHIGVLLAMLDAHTHFLFDPLNWVQHKLFDAGGQLAMPGHVFIAKSDVAYLETLADLFNQDLPPLKEFILPGGHKIVAQLHLARAVARRAERHLVHLAFEIDQGHVAETHLNEDLLVQLLNRLSDVLFIMARYACIKTKTPEVLWKNLNQKP